MSCHAYTTNYMCHPCVCVHIPSCNRRACLCNIGLRNEMFCTLIVFWWETILISYFIFATQAEVVPWKLWAAVGCLVLVDLALLISWAVLDPLKREVQLFPCQKKKINILNVFVLKNRFGNSSAFLPRTRRRTR